MRGWSPPSKDQDLGMWGCRNVPCPCLASRPVPGGLCASRCPWANARCAQVSLLSHGPAAPAAVWGAQQCPLALPCLIPHPSVGSSPVPGELHPSLCFPKSSSTRDPSQQLPAMPAGAEPCLQVCPAVLGSLWMFPRFPEHLELLLLLLRCFLLTCAPPDPGHLPWCQTGQTGMDSGSPDSPGPSSPSLDWDLWKTHLCSRSS